MNIIDAWKQAKEKQEIEKRTSPKCSVKKMLTMADFTEWLSSVCPSGAILADDWEVVSEVKSRDIVASDQQVIRINGQPIIIDKCTQITISWGGITWLN